MFFGYIVIEQRSERELLGNILGVVCDTVLPADHVEEIIQPHTNPHAQIFSDESSNIALDVVSFEFCFDGGLDGLARVLTVTCCVYRPNHVLYRFFNRLCVFVEQFERCDFLTIPADVRERILNMDFRTAPPNRIANGDERQGQDHDHVEGFTSRGNKEHDGAKRSGWHAGHPRGGDFSKHAEINGFGTTGEAHTDHGPHQRVRCGDGYGQKRHGKHENGRCCAKLCCEPSGWRDVGDFLTNGFHHSPTPSHDTDGDTG